MSIASLIATGTKVWLDGVDPSDLAKNLSWGATGATSNPIIISEIIAKGGFERRLAELIEQGLDDDAIAWSLDDELVRSAQEDFLPAWEKTGGDDGYVSFELDPLIEDDSRGLSHAERVRRYVELGRKWSEGHRNRMIKVPATAAGLDALEELAAAGVTLNVTLLFTERQHRLACEAVWRGMRRRPDQGARLKSVYSIFVSRLDVYTEKQVPELSPAAQGQVGIVNAKRIWRLNREFWKDKPVRLHPEMVFASTGTKKAGDPPDKYVEALAGSDIQTNPPATNEAVNRSGRAYRRAIDAMPPEAVLREIEAKVDPGKLERTLMAEGIRKFVEPQQALLRLIAQKRSGFRAAAGAKR